MSIITLGEMIARRRLKTAKLGPTQLRYVSGQGKATKLSDEDAMVSYVDLSGAVNVIPCEWRDGEAFHREVLIHATPYTAEVRHLRRQSPVSPGVQTLMRNLFDPPAEKEEAPPPPRPKGEEASQDPES